jgi:hypothetical protein
MLVTRQLEEEPVVAPVPAGPGRGPCGLRGRLAGLARASRSLVRCPVAGCRDQIDPSRLMCRRHWYLVPKQVRDRVWATWRSGQGALSMEHLEAVCMAMTACQAAI